VEALEVLGRHCLAAIIALLFRWRQAATADVPDAVRRLDGRAAQDFLHHFERRKQLVLDHVLLDALLRVLNNFNGQNLTPAECARLEEFSLERLRSLADDRGGGPFGAQRRRTADKCAHVLGMLSVWRLGAITTRALGDMAAKTESKLEPVVISRALWRVRISIADSDAVETTTALLNNVMGLFKVGGGGGWVL
jgi:hypothetical protein